MKLKVLVDNNTYIDNYYYGEPAVSYYIEDEGTRLLLDVGYSDLFLKNALAFGIDLSEVDVIAISHGHDDHTGGLKPFFEQNMGHSVTVVAHPDAFHAKVIDGLSIGSPLSQASLEGVGKLVLSKVPMKVSPNITFLGEIPRVHAFEKNEPIGQRLKGDVYVPDDLLDDTAFVYQSEEGLTIITGCSHSGICNIIDYAKTVCHDERVQNVIGGFHLFKINERVCRTIDFLKAQAISGLYPCHCTSFEVRAEMFKSLKVKEVGVGFELTV